MIGGFCNFLALCLMAVSFLGVISCNQSPQKPLAKEETKAQFSLSDDVERVLQRRMNLVTSLLREPPILEAVRVSNAKHQDITLAEILSLDQKWRKTKGIDDFVKPLLTNTCAQHLIDFQQQHGGIPEVFIADAKGLNVCQTNKTSDYYQADEDWWIRAFNEGKGRTYHGEIEYDESARSEAIAVYVPVIDPQTNKAIGVCKTIVDITSIKREL